MIPRRPAKKRSSIFVTRLFPSPEHSAQYACHSTSGCFHRPNLGDVPFKVVEGHTRRKLAIGTLVDETSEDRNTPVT